MVVRRRWSNLHRLIRPRVILRLGLVKLSWGKACRLLSPLAFICQVTGTITKITNFRVWSSNN
ncbi:unnamed protein product [Acanthoscelides obtectus]|uniref:Uncharacterized protein n=1 Tax=Acanthoscelides obtectus TaxID=200917 RepID=A0A9P0QAF0_ACAOB|nr:unnamed protein product [Acanthoscelides obtectus]CAK1682839.1 hypothetical protein AOBTE_LOCUS33922 [Acanthoscelides obtectus]